MAKVARGLPDNIASGIGRIIARWSYQEALIRLIVKNSTGMNIKTARIALREPKIEELGVFLADVLFVEGLQPRVSIPQLVKKLKDAKERRDLLAHSQWVREDGTNALGIQWLRGAWDRQANQPRITRKMKPAFLPVDMAYLQATRRMIDDTINLSVQLNAEILRLREALREGLLLHAVRGYLRRQIEVAPKPRRRSSAS